MSLAAKTPSAAAAAAAASSPALPAVGTARLVEVSGDGRARIQIGSREIDATLDPGLHPAVVRTALARNERVLVEQDPDTGAFVVIAALRTTPIPGVDEAEEFVIKAQRVRVETSGEFSVVAGAASFAVRAYGYVETLAEQITSRASSLHRVVGRVLHLN